jgi:NitT/TauT family transport system substrate-binding protein
VSTWARLIGLAAASLLVACGSEPQAPMRVGTVLWPGNEILAAADHAGRLDTAAVRRVEFSSSQEVLRALRNGVIEGAALMLDETLLSARDGLDLVILVAVDSSNGGDGILARSPIADLAGLAGKRVGVQVNSGSVYVLQQAFKRANLPLNAITIVNLPPERQVSWFDLQQVDAVVTYEPMRTQLADRGAVELFNSRVIADDVINLLVVERSYLTGHPAQGRALIEGWRAGLEVFRASPSARAWSARRLGLTAEQFEQMTSRVTLFDEARNRELLDPNAPQLRATADRVHAFLREVGVLPADVPVAPLFRLPAGFQR